MAAFANRTAQHPRRPGREKCPQAVGHATLFPQSRPNLGLRASGSFIAGSYEPRRRIAPYRSAGRTEYGKCTHSPPAAVRFSSDYPLSSHLPPRGERRTPKQFLRLFPRLPPCPRLPPSAPVFPRECGRGGQKTRGAPLRAPVDGSPSARQADLRSLPSDQVSKGSRDLEEITVSLRDIAIFTRISVQEQHRHLRRRER